MTASEGTRAREYQRLQHDVRWAFENGLGPRDLVPMLERLIECAPAGSSSQHSAMLQLAELVVGDSPWRAALLCRRVLSVADTHRAHGVLGLALSVLGHHKAAARSYWRAVALCPECVEYNHNLGHLLDVGLGKHDLALGLLKKAHLAAPEEAEIAGSYAHALLAADRRAEAAVVLRGALGSATRAEELLRDWEDR